MMTPATWRQHSRHRRLARFDGSVVLVTGGGAGIGRAVAMGFARGGAAVHVLDRDGDKAQATADEIAALGVPGVAIDADVTNEMALEAAVDGIVAAAGRIDVLVNNAGIAWMGPALDMPLEALQAMLRVNVEGVFIASRAVLEQIHRLFQRGTLGGLSEWQLLDRYHTRRDESAFELLMLRHGAMVLLHEDRTTALNGTGFLAIEARRLNIPR